MSSTCLLDIRQLHNDIITMTQKKQIDTRSYTIRLVMKLCSHFRNWESRIFYHWVTLSSKLGLGQRTLELSNCYCYVFITDALERSFFYKMRVMTAVEILA